MPRYIDADALTEHIEHENRMWGDEYDAYQILGDIEDMPTANVKPVVRGEWEVIDGCVCCSVCGEPNMERNFCPNCGADMRGEQDG